MKKLNLSFLGAAMVASLVFFTGCKKEKEEEPTSKVKATPNDQQGSSEADEAIANVNDFINNKIGGGAGQKIGAYNLPCGVVQLDSTEAGGKKTYRFTYGRQSACGYKKKSGEVSFSRDASVPFDQAGSEFTITLTNYVVEVEATGSIVTLNGTIKVVNETGGYIWEPVLSSSTTVTHKVRGTFTVKYSDDTERIRNYYQKRSWASTGNWAGLSLTIAGDTTFDGGTTMVYETGKTYANNYDYKTEMLTSYVWSNCGQGYAGPYVLKTGKARMNVTIPFVSTSYIEVEGGYYWNYNNATSTPVLINDCTTNAYKITANLAGITSTQYQLY